VVFSDFESTLKAIMAMQRRLPGVFTYTAYDREYMEKAASIYGGEVHGSAVMIGIMGIARWSITHVERPRIFRRSMAART
jgi:hypothetical protein